MTLQVSIFDNRNNKLYNVTNAIIGPIKYDTQLEDQPGKCTFKIIRDGGIAFWEGATVSVIVDGVKMFKGFVFIKKRNTDSNIIELICYDQLRYLKNNSSKRISNVTSSQFFASICNEFLLKYSVADSSNYVCTPAIKDNRPLYEMIKYTLHDTLINTGKWFIIRDNFGVLEHVNILNLHSGYVIGDQSGLIEFEYETSIDNSYNQIVLYRDNKDTGKRESVIVNDTINGGKNLKEWGILQLYQSVDENMNIAQMDTRAQGLLTIYNNTSRKLQLNKVIGKPEIFAGSLIGCQIKDLGDISLNGTLLVTKCTHIIDNESHMMKLLVEVI